MASSVSRPISVVGAACLGRGRLEEPIAQRARLGARSDAELAAQGAVEPLELTKSRMPVAALDVAAHQLDVRLLVAGVERGEVLPPARQPQQVEMAQAQGFAPNLGPLVVAVLRAQLAAVQAQRLERQVDVGRGERPPGQLVEGDGVDGDLGVGEQLDGLVVEHDGVGVSGRAAGEMGRLVQLRRGDVERSRPAT